jgi:hypothetical protein
MIRYVYWYSNDVPVILSDLNESWIFSTHSGIISKYHISWKSAQWEKSLSTRADGRTDRRTDMTKIIDALRYFAKSFYKTPCSGVLWNSVSMNFYFSSRLIFKLSPLKLIINFRAWFQALPLKTGPMGCLGTSVKKNISEHKQCKTAEERRPQILFMFTDVKIRKAWSGRPRYGGTYWAINSTQQDRQCAYNVTLRHCCSGNAMSITYCECVFVALGILHEMRMRYIVICGLPGYTNISHIIS